MYVEPKHEQEYHEIYFKLVKELFNACPDKVILAMIMEVSQKFLRNHYQALKKCKKLLNFEAELLTNVPG